VKQKDEFKQNSRQKSILIEGRGVDFGMKLFRFIIPKYPYFNVYTRVKMPPRGAVSVATAVAQRNARLNRVGNFMRVVRADGITHPAIRAGGLPSRASPESSVFRISTTAFSKAGTRLTMC